MSSNPANAGRAGNAPERRDRGGPMRAVVQSRYGDADTWRVELVEPPTVEPAEVLVEVRAAGLDRGTWHLMTGTPYVGRPAFGLRAPRTPIPGRDLAGVVVAVGNEVSRFAPGDEVFGIGRGTLAELAVAREDKLVPKPGCLTFEQAAATAISGLSALQALCDAGRLAEGQHVLILGASGGVGTFAVQIAKAQGATVTAVCSTAKADLVAALGADHVVDYTSGAALDTTTTGGRRYDLILDIAGGRPLRELRRALTRRGTLVIVGAEGGRWFGGLDRQLRALIWSPFVGQRLTALVSRERLVDLERLAALATDGGFVPVVDTAYPLDDAADAMRHLAAGQARGKLVVTTQQDAR